MPTCAYPVQEGADFEEAAEQYVAHYLRKGIPSLFSSVKQIYR